jgi:hypothetical protein
MKTQPEQNKQAVHESKRMEQQKKRSWVPPVLKVGSLLVETGQGGTSKEYDAWDTKRSK